GVTTRRLPATYERRGVAGNDLVIRSASALVLLLVALLATYLGGLAAGVVVAILAVLVHLEWTELTGASRGQAIPSMAAVAGAILLASAGFVPHAAAIAVVATLVGAAVARDAWVPGGIFYAAAFGIALLAIRGSPDLGLAGLVFVLAVVVATDTGAYFAGRLIGGAKLWPAVSPNKTWAGAVGGFVAAPIAGGVIAQFVEVPLTLGLILTACLLSIVCQIGDLFESWVKRRFGAKDSGRIIPGHGGMMDRVDGLIFAATAAALIGALRGGTGDIARGFLLW